MHPFIADVLIEQDIATVEAGAWVYFVGERREPLFSIRRQMMTTGLTSYTLSTKDAGDVAIIQFRAMGVARTQAILFLDDYLARLDVSETEPLQQYFQGVLWRFQEWLLKDIRRFDEKAENLERFAESMLSQRKLSDLLPQRIGRRPTPANEWARQQYEAGISIDDMLVEYMEQYGEDPKDPKERRKARDRLRKALGQ